MVIFNEKLKELRKANNFSQKELGEKLGVTNYSVSDWEQGRAQPDFETLVKISKLFAVSTDYLLGLED